MEHKYLLKQFSYLIGLLTGRVWPSDIIEIMFFTQYAIPPKGGDTTFISTKLIELSFKKESVDLIEEILTRPPYPEGESFPSGVAGTAAGGGEVGSKRPPLPHAPANPSGGGGGRGIHTSATVYRTAVGTAPYGDGTVTPPVPVVVGPGGGAGIVKNTPPRRG